ncbi:MAG TPA: WcaI family glycosyltransferase [Bryobacteraceae bacterium]|jgi:colanic acid biosynthesis glycosyl transferase WcaI
MRILVHSIFYRPDLTGVAKYTAEMCEWLAARGHEVSVIAPPPHYPQWRVPLPYRAWKYSSEILDGVRVWRSPLWVPTRPSGLRRILYSLSFLLLSAPLALRAALRPADVIIAIQPSLLSAITAWITARITGAAAWLHIQDYELDLAFSLGQLRSGRRLALALESWLMRRFDVVSSITPRMLETARLKGVKDECLFLLPNWFDPETIRPVPPEATLRAELGFAPSETIVLFAGSLGAKQGLEILLEAARLTPRVIFFICGDGVMAQRLHTQASGLANVRFVPLQPADRLNALLNTADIHALPQDPSAANAVMPSKLIGMLASGRPIVAATAPGTEIAELVDGCGIRVPPADPHAFSSAILTLAADPGVRRQLGQAARARALSMFRSDVILPSFESQIRRVTKRELPKKVSRFAAQ